MGTELTPMQTFQERVKAKLRDDIGSLLPDEAIAEMVQRVIKEEFFTKETVNKGTGYSPNLVEKPSKFQEMVLEACKPIIEKQVILYMSENIELIQAQLDAAVSKGLVNLVVETLDRSISGIIGQQGFNLQQALDNMLRQRGVIR